MLRDYTRFTCTLEDYQAAALIIAERFSVVASLSLPTAAHDGRVSMQVHLQLCPLSMIQMVSRILQQVIQHPLTRPNTAP